MKRGRPTLVLLIVLSFPALLALAQHAGHSTIKRADVIDGAKTPDLIPDLTAWRLWLLSVTAEDGSRPELSEARRKAFLNAAGIPDVEIAAAEEGIAQFRTQYAALMNNYSLRLKAGENPLPSEFRAQRDALVQEIQTACQGYWKPQVWTD